MPRPRLPPTYVTEVMTQPHPGSRPRDRLCWLGGLPSWSRGQIKVRATDGVIYQRAAPKWMADNLLRCHPEHWDGNKPPTRKDFESPDWFETFQPLGLVQI
jgi:hypothetical protein